MRVLGYFFSNRNLILKIPWIATVKRCKGKKRYICFCDFALTPLFYICSKGRNHVRTMVTICPINCRTISYNWKIKARSIKRFSIFISQIWFLDLDEKLKSALINEDPDPESLETDHQDIIKSLDSATKKGPIKTRFQSHHFRSPSSKCQHRSQRTLSSQYVQLCQ